MIAIQTSLNKVGIRGNELQQQNKQAIVSSMIMLNENNKISSKKLLNQMIV